MRYDPYSGRMLPAPDRNPTAFHSSPVYLQPALASVSLTYISFNA